MLNLSGTKRTDSRLSRFCADQSGAASSIELVLLAVLAVTGLIAGIVATRDAITCELADVAGSVQDTNQSFSYQGVVGLSGTSSGSSFIDATDECDTPEDLAGQAESCITFDGPPSDEIATSGGGPGSGGPGGDPGSGGSGGSSVKTGVSDDEFVVLFDFESGLGDTAPIGLTDSGTLVDDAFVAGGALILDGTDDYFAIADSADINLGPVDARTIYVEFSTNDIQSGQAIFESGDETAGFAIFVRGGQVHTVAYDFSGATPYTQSFATQINVGETYSVTVVNDSTAGPNGFAGAYLNGVQFGSSTSAQSISAHPGGVGLGGINGRSFFDNASESKNLFGQINALKIFNRGLSETEVTALSNQ